MPFLTSFFFFFLLFTVFADSSKVIISATNCSVVAAVLYTLLISVVLYTGFQALVFFKRAYDVFGKSFMLTLATNPWVVFTFCSGKV